MTPEMKAVRLRLYEDFEFYAEHALKVRTKDLTIEPFRFNEAQKRLSEVVERQMATTGKVRVVLLKARQTGISTWVGGRLYSRVSQRQACKAMVLTHESKATKALLDITHRYHKLVPDILRPQTQYASRNELKFGVLDSGYVVATAGSDSVGRGETLTHVHASEAAFWPASSAAANFNGLLQAVPDRPGTEVYVESTANGVSGLFYDFWKESVKGTNGFEAVFLPWFIEPGYRDPVPAGFQRLPHEEKMVEEFGLDDAQLCFRRRKVAEGGLDKFHQEFPSTAEEAFLTSGRPVFNPPSVAAMIRDACQQFSPGAILGAHWEAPERFALEGQKWLPHVRGELLQYHPYDPAETYVIGADPAMGVGKDASVAQVLDSRRRQVAVWRSSKVEADEFATVLFHLGRRYGDARIIVERNAHGLVTCRVLERECNYRNLFMEVTIDKMTDTEREVVGFLTTSKSKPLIIDELRAQVRDSTIEINDAATLSEMQSFVVGDSGKMAAEKGCTDDLVMALALANHIVEDNYAPVECPDELYINW